MSSAPAFGEKRAAELRAGLRAHQNTLLLWPRYEGEPSRLCILLFAESAEWLIDCPKMSDEDGWIATGESFDDAPVLAQGRSLVFSNLSVPFEQAALMVGLAATYRDDTTGETTPVIVVEEWETLHKHHPGFRESPFEEWLGGMAHEGFHTYQMWHPQVKPWLAQIEQKTLAPQESLSRAYDAHPDLREAVGQENAALSAAIDDAAPTPEKARRALSAWLKQSRHRHERFAAVLEQAMPGQRASEAEQFWCFMEGLARYAEMHTMIAADEGLAALAVGAQDFHGFERSRGKRVTQIPGYGNPGRGYYLTLGAKLGFLLDRADPTWREHLFDDERLLLGAIERAVRPRQ